MSARHRVNRQRKDEYGRPLVTPVINLRLTNAELRQQTRDLTEGDGFGPLDMLSAVASNPDVYEIAKCVPERRPGDPGRPADYPVWVFVIWQALILAGLSQRGVRRHLKHPKAWQIVLESAADVLGAEEVRKVPLVAPQRHHWRYWSGVLCDHFDDYRTRFRACAHAQAKSQGLLTITGKRPVNSASRTNNIAVDGKVFSSPTKHTSRFKVDRTTGEMVLGEDGLPITQRIDPAAFWAKEGGNLDGKGRWAYGPKYVTMSCRGYDYYSRVVLDVVPQSKGGHGGGEAGAATRMLEGWLDDFSGAETITSDGVLRGVHIRRRAAKDVRVVGPTHAKIKADKALGKGRVAKNRSLGTIRPTRRCSHQLAAIDGRVNEVFISETADLAAQPLSFRLTRGQRKGKTAWYHLVTIPCRHGDKTINGEACHQTSIPAVEGPTDTVSGFNRAEVLRQVPPETELYDEIKGWQKDAESVHAQYELGLYQRRICAYGNRRQLLVIFGLALGMNSLAKWIASGRHLDTEAPPLNLAV